MPIPLLNECYWADVGTGNPWANTVASSVEPATQEKIEERVVFPAKTQKIKRRGQDSNTLGSESRNTRSANDLEQSAVFVTDAVAQNQAQLELKADEIELLRCWQLLNETARRELLAMVQRLSACQDT